MQKLLTAALLLIFCWRLPAQTPEALVHDVQANVSSMSQLLKILQKHAVSRDTLNNWRFDTVALLGHKKLGECYRYVQRTGGYTVHKLVFLDVIYKAEQVAYIRIKDEYHDPAIDRSVEHTLLTYVDSAYSAGVLAGYNTKNGTGFTWHDLFEDKLTNFSVWPGLPVPHYDSNGVMIDEPFLAEEMLLFVPLIKKRDHAEIVKNCQSFNPTRKAFGAVCLYVLQQLGESLSAEEERLLKEIRASEETTDLSAGCRGSQGVPLNAFLTEKGLRSMSDQVISEGKLAK